MNKFLLVLGFCLAGGVALPPTALAGDDWVVASDQTVTEGRVVGLVKGDIKPIQFGPVVFLGHRQIKSVLIDLSMSEAPYLKGFAVVPALYPGKISAADGDLGSYVIASQIVFDGSTDEYKTVLAEASDESVLNVKGAAQTVVGAGLMALGAVFNNQWLGAIGMTSAGNSSEFGSLIKDDPTWFKSAGAVPTGTQRAVVVLTWIDRRNEAGEFVRTNLYTTLFLTRSETANGRLAELVAYSIRPILAQRLNVLNDKQRAWLNEHGWAKVQVTQ